MSKQRPVLAAVILAAGYSSRMGRFKALLPMCSESIIARVVGTFRQAGIEEIVAITGHSAELLEPDLHGMDVRAVRNPGYSRGMYSSVQVGVAALPSDVDACFLLPVDIPLVRPATVAALAARFAVEYPPITYPCFAGQRGHPPLISRSLFAEILNGNGDGGLRPVLERYQTTAINVDVLDEGVLLDMDTPDDYAQLASLALRRHLPTLAECEAILAARTTAEPLRRHGRAVAAVAKTLADRLATRGTVLDLNLVLAASLLHDIAKGQPGHADVGATQVSSLGYPIVADVIRQHMSMRFDGDTPDEAAIVFLADKLVSKDRRVPLEDRYRPSFERFRDQPEALQGATRRYETARAILAVVERKARASLSDILADCEVPICP